MFKLAVEEIISDDDFTLQLNNAIGAMVAGGASSFSTLTWSMKCNQLTRDQFERLDEAVLNFGSNTDDSFWIVDVGTHYKERLASIMRSDNWFIMCINMLDAYLQRNSDDPQRGGDDDEVLNWIYQQVHERIVDNISDMVTVRNMILLERWMQFNYGVRDLKLAMIAAGVARDYCYDITEIAWYNNNFDAHYAAALHNFYDDLDDCAQVGVVI